MGHARQPLRISKQTYKSGVGDHSGRARGAGKVLFFWILLPEGLRILCCRLAAPIVTNCAAYMDVSCLAKKQLEPESKGWFDW